MILKRHQVAEIVTDTLSELRFPIDDPPAFDRGEIIPVASSLYTEPDCWIKITGWWPDGAEWVVTFARAPRPREMARQFLASNGRTKGKPLREPHPLGTDLEIVERVGEAISLCDEPEMLSRAISGEYGKIANGARGRGGFTSLRHAAAVEQARESRKQLAMEKRMLDAQRRAKLQHVNVSGEMHVLKSMLDRAKTGGRHEPPAAIRKLEAIENRLDGLEEAA
ncbi:MAG TPA: hypothetical protein VK631_20045 [Solirubrobacteraceae bacterium]|nr:hypothetical protein [Solirubrobacteraceae bacterium]